MKLTTDQSNIDLPSKSEAEVYQTLRWALARKRGFGLFFVQCSPTKGREISQKLTADLPQKRMQTLTLKQPVDTLYDLVEHRWQTQPFDILLIEGLGKSLLNYEGSKRLSGWSKEEIYELHSTYFWRGVPPLLNHLNQKWESFRDHLPACFVFLVPAFVIKYLVQRGPDFLGGQADLFVFPDTLEAIQKETQQILADNDYARYDNLTLGERNEKLLKIQELLETPYQSLEQKAALFHEHGRILSAAQHYEAAIASYDKSLAIKLDDHQVWNSRGNALSNLEHYEEAISSYDKAATIKPDYHPAWMNRGLALSHLEHYEEAIASYDQAIAINPDTHQAWYNRGNALDNLKRYEEAIASYDKAAAIQPDYHPAWMNRGFALLTLERDEEAIASYEKALGIRRKMRDRKGEAAALQALAGLYNQSGKVLQGFALTQQAMQILQRLNLPIDDMPYPIWTKAGMKFAEGGKFQTAVLMSLTLLATPLLLLWLILLSSWRIVSTQFHRHRNIKK
jgi:tetratricopeptide (TPR) repeat protein